MEGGAAVARKRAALLAVSPICPLIPAAVLGFVAIAQPWWTTRQDITFFLTNVSSVTVTQRSEISLWGHHGCRLNETWRDICALPASECKQPPPAPVGYVPPWTPPPPPVDDGSWRQQLVTGPPGVRITTTREDRPFRCVSGNCAGPPVTTTAPPSNYQAPAYAGDGNTAFGDAQARLGDEVVSSNEDAFRLPPGPPPPPVTTRPPTHAPEVGYVNPIVLQTNPPTTSWAAQGPFAGLWRQTGSGTEDVGNTQLFYEKQHPNLQGPGGGGAFPGAQIAVEKCPPYAKRYWDPLSPPAGQFICSLYATCGKMNPILVCLFLGEGLLGLNLLVLVSVGLGGMDVAAAYTNVVCLPIILVTWTLALILAGSAGLSPPVHEMVSVGAICAILAVLLVALGLVVACMALFSHFAIDTFVAKAEAAARVAAEHAQASLEATEEWRLQQDAERAKKKPAPLGWRTAKVQPEEVLGLEDVAERGSLRGSERGSLRGSSGSLPETPGRESLQAAMTLALADVPRQPEVHAMTATHVSLPVRTAEAAPSPATEQCMTSFVNSPEGAVFAQRLGQPAPEGEWVPKLSRSNGQTYYVNMDTGETRWSPPSAWQDTTRQNEAPKEWKKKRLKNGTVISVRA